MYYTSVTIAENIDTVIAAGLISNEATVSIPGVFKKSGTEANFNVKTDGTAEESVVNQEAILHVYPIDQYSYAQYFLLDHPKEEAYM